MPSMLLKLHLGRFIRFAGLTDVPNTLTES